MEWIKEIAQFRYTWELIISNAAFDRRSKCASDIRWNRLENAIFQNVCSLTVHELKTLNDCVFNNRRSISNTHFVQCYP